VDTLACSEWDGESFMDVFLPFTCSFCFRIDLSYQLSLRLDIPCAKTCGAPLHPCDHSPAKGNIRACPVLSESTKSGQDHIDGDDAGVVRRARSVSTHLFHGRHQRAGRNDSL